MQPDPSEINKKKRKTNRWEDKFENDVTFKLIKRDKGLVARDKHARLRKLQLKKRMNDKIFALKESEENSEIYKDWWSQDIDGLYFAMNSRHRTCYKKGD